MVNPQLVTAQGPDRVPAAAPTRLSLPEPDVRAVQAILASGGPDAVDRAVAALQRTAPRSGIEQAQLATLRAIATDPRYGTPDRALTAARMYVELLGAGCYVVLAETQPGRNVTPAQARESRDNLDAMLRGAVAVWRGTDIRRPAYDGLAREQRLAVLVDEVSRNLAAGRTFRQSIDAARSTMQTRITQVELDNVDFPSRPTLVRGNQPAERMPVDRNGRSIVDGAPRHAGPNPRSFTLPPAAAARPLTAGPRPAGAPDAAPLAAAANPALRNAPPERIGGTDIAWTPDAVAQYVAQQRDDEKRIEALHGLRMPDRVAVAESYARARGQALQGPQALAFMSEQLAGRGNGLNATVIRDILRPDNESGIVSEHILIYSDATGGNFVSRLIGIGGPNHEAIERILMFRSPAELRRIDEQMQATPHINKSLRDVIRMVNVPRGRERLLFLLDIPGRDRMAEVPSSELQAWTIRAALDDFDKGMFGNVQNTIQAFSTVEWNNIYRTLSVQSPRELRALAAAYHRQQIAAGHQVQGGDGSTGNIADSAFGRALLGAANTVFSLAPGNQEAEMRVRIALQGLRFDPQEFVPRQNTGESAEAYAARAQATVAEAESHHRQRVAQYVAYSLQVADRSRLATDDIQYALSLIRRPPRQGEAPMLNGRPYPAEVIAYWQRLTGRQINPEDFDSHVRLLQAANNSTVGAFQQQNNYNLLLGEGTDGPASRAVQLMASIGGGTGLISGPYRQRTYQLLDMRGIPEEQRDDFMTQTAYAYAQLNPGHTLLGDIQRAFGATMQLPGGATIPTQAMRLAQRGVSSNAERVIYALYEPGVMGLVRSENVAEVTRILGELTPLEKVILRQEFQRLTGRDLRAELDGYPGREARMAAMATRVFPHERDLLGAQAMIYLNAPTTDPALAARRDALGRNQAAMTDFWARNFADPAGLQSMVDLVNQTGGAAQFSMRAIDTAPDIQASVRAAQDAAIGNPVTAAIQDFLTNDADGIRIRRLALDTYTQRAAREIQATGAVSPQTQAEMAFVIRDLKERLRKRGIDVDSTTELVSNIMVTTALVGAMAINPTLSGMWMSVIGGGTGLATRMALGQVDTLSQGVGIFINDAAKGLAFQQAALIASSIPVETPILVQGLVGASVGYNSAIITETARFITDPMLWRMDPQQAVANYQYNLSSGINRGMVWGAGSFMLFGYIRQRLERHAQPDPQGPTDPGTGPTRPVDPDRPVTGPTRPPVTPGGPDRPVTPGEPPVIPGRPTGPGNIGNTGGPVPRPGVRPDVGTSPVGDRLGQRPGQIGTPTGPTPGRPGSSLSPPAGTVDRPPVGTTPQPGRDPSPVTTGPSRDIPTNPVAPVVGRQPGGNTGIGTGTPVRVGTRSMAMPGSPYQATYAADNTAWTMNVATMHWTSIAAAAGTVGGMSITRNSATDQLRANAAAVLPVDEVARAMAVMSSAERRQAVREAAGAFAFTALTYMETHEGRLPGPEGEQNDFNTLLDLAWNDANLANGRAPSSVSRATKVTELSAYYWLNGQAQPSPAGDDRAQPVQPGRAPAERTPGPRTAEPGGPAPSGPATSQAHAQLAAATGNRLRGVSPAWVNANLQSYLSFRSGEALKPYPEGGVEYWAPRINQLPNRPLPTQLRDDAEALQAFGFRMPRAREGGRVDVTVTPALVAARDRARSIALLGGTPQAPAQATVPQLFESLPRLRDFMVAAAGRPLAQIPTLAQTDALEQAVRAYKQTLRSNPRSAALMNGVADDASITPAVLEAHAHATGVSGPNPLPDDAGALKASFGPALDALRAANEAEFAERLAAVMRIEERLLAMNALSQEERNNASLAIANAVLQGEQRTTRVATFIANARQAALAAEVWRHIDTQLTPQEKTQIAVWLASGQDPATLRNVPVEILRSLDRLEVNDPAYRQAARRLRELTIGRLVEARNGQALLTDELGYALRYGSPELIAQVLAFGKSVNGGEALIMRAFIDSANAGRSDRVAVALQGMFAREEPGMRDYSIQLMQMLWSPNIIRQVQANRRDNLAVATAYNALSPGQRPEAPLAPIADALGQTQEGRVALQQMLNAVYYDAVNEMNPLRALWGAENYEGALRKRIEGMLRQPLAAPPATQG